MSPGVSRRGKGGVSRQGEEGFRGTAGGVSRQGETPPAMPPNTSRRALKPHLCRASKPLGTESGTKIFKFRLFLGFSEQNEIYHTPLQSKIWDLNDRIFLVEDLFNKTLFFRLQDASLRAFKNLKDMFLLEEEVDLVFIQRLASTSEKEAFNAFRAKV